MARKKPDLSKVDFGDQDTERPPEEQLDKLQRAYRPADLKRAVFYSKTQSALNKQQRMIDTLDKEKEELQLNYNKAKEGMFLRQDAMWLRQFEDLLKCQSTSKAIKDEETHKIKEMDEKLRQVDRQMHQLRRHLLKMRKHRNVVSSNDKTIHILEDRWYQESVKHNKIVYKNLVLREYLQHLLILRTRFNILYAHYNKVLNKGKVKIEHLFKEASAAQDERDEIRAHLISLNKYSTVQYNRLVAEVQEMSRLTKLKGKYVPFMMKKEKTRVGCEEDFGIKQEKTDAKPEEQLKFYQDTFDKIKNVTQKSDANEIVKHFIEAEEENFKLFNYANELRDESERIQEKITGFQERLREANMQDEMEKEKFVVVKETMEEKLKEIERKQSSLLEKLNLCRKTFGEFEEGIRNLYTYSECSDEYLLKMLCGEKGINEDNALDYLGILESWISDLVPFSDYLTNRAKFTGEEGKESGKPVAAPKYDVAVYSKLSAISGSIAPSIQMSIASIQSSREGSPDVEDIKPLPFPDLDLPQLTREPGSAALDEEQPLKPPLTNSQLNLIASEKLQHAEPTVRKPVKK